MFDEYDSYFILVVEVMGFYVNIFKYYNMSDIFINFGLINKVDRRGMTLV